MSIRVSTTDSFATLAEVMKEADGERMRRYAEYLAFYDGEQWEGRRRAGETQLVVNYARTFIRKGTSYLFTASPAFQVLGPDGKQAAGAEAVEGVLSEFYASSDLHALDYEAAIDAAVLGDGIFKTTWSARLGRPVVGAIDPRTVLAWPWPDDRQSVYRVEQRLDMLLDEARVIYELGDDVTLGGASAQATPGRVVVCETWTDATYDVVIAGQAVRTGSNPYGWIPYDIFPNVPRPFEFWGESDMVDLLQLCRELNERMTTLARIMQVSGYPITVLENVEKASGIRAEPGAIWELPEDSRAYLLDMLAGQGVRLHIEFLDQLRMSLHDIAETPRTAFGDSGRTLSGAALEVEIQPLVQKITRKRRVWDSVYRRRNAKLLDLMERLGGVSLGGLRRTSPQWGSVLPSDRESLVREEVQLVQAGIHSRERSAELLGEDDPTALFEQWAAEARAIAALRPVTAGGVEAGAVIARVDGGD